MRLRLRIALVLLVAACVPVAEVPSASPDTCGAQGRAALVGGPAVAIPAGDPGQSRRIIRPGDSVTEDFSDQRINYHLDAVDRVVRITCG